MVKGIESVISNLKSMWISKSSEWNDKNLFCGWYDADLSEKGVQEARQAGQVDRKIHLFDFSFDKPFFWNYSG